MRWYDGDIAEAVSISKSKNAVFVVYVEGNDESSINLTTHINHAEISSKLESDKFVAIKIEAGSVSHTQFAAIFKDVTVPSIFFIGKNGKTLDIVLASSDVNDLSNRIDSVIKVHTSTVNNADLTVPEANQSKSNEDVVCEDGVCYKVARPTTSTQQEQQQQLSEENVEKDKNPNVQLTKEEKIQRAKELIEKKREEKQQEEDEENRLKEIERRKVGQDVQKLRRRQQDDELKVMLENRQRSKNEEKLARERILAQIQQDKLERAARFASNIQQPQQQSEPKPIVTASTSNNNNSSGSNANTTRIQFRLPDGTSRMHVFQSDATLRELRQYASENLCMPFRNFTLSTTFPRHEFTQNELDQTVENLELCPNAVILVLPGQASGTVSSPTNSTLVSFFWLLLAPIVGLFSYIRHLFFGPPSTPSTSDAVNNKRSAGQTINDSSTNQPSPKRRNTDSTVIRRQGNSNVHRLADKNDSDDDNNTWNGNSTQQM